MTNRRALFVLLAGALLAASFVSRSQTAGTPARIGFLGNSLKGPLGGDLTEEFVKAMRALGWSQGHNISFDYRWSEQRNERFPDLARELVTLNVDLIVVTAGVTAALAAKQVTATTPILLVGGADPVKFGLVASFGHPGGNVTGLMQPLVDWGKWIELAREAIPGAQRIAVLANSTSVVYADYVLQNRAAALRLGLQVQILPVALVQDLDSAFAQIRRVRAAALIVGPDTFLLSHMDEILALAQADRLPVIGPNRRTAEMGAMVSYGADYRYISSQAAVYADKILKGAKPADLPIDQPSRFDLVVNARIAKALGITLPQSLLLRADEVIQ